MPTNDKRTINLEKTKGETNGSENRIVRPNIKTIEPEDPKFFLKDMPNLFNRRDTDTLRTNEFPQSSEAGEEESPSPEPSK